jgi:hypothetical protein
MRRAILPALIAGCALLAIAAPAPARTNIAVGIGDQQAGTFGDRNFRALRITKARYFIRWDAIRHPDAMAAAEWYVATARRAHVRVLMHISTNDLRKRRAQLPSVARYRRDVGRLVRHFKRRGVREWGVWNEANHVTQPTYRNPRRAAQYFRVMRRICGPTCKIVALDVLDQRGSERYIRRWFAALSRSYRAKVRIVGVHNYSDTNRFRSRGTAAILRTVKRYDRRADFWLTETGGVVNFGGAFPCNERRAAKAVRYMFHLARRYRHDVKRLYAYNWTGANCNGFDAGLVRADGSRRPGYYTFRSQLARFRR